MRRGLKAALVSVVCLAGARDAAAQSFPNQARPVPGKVVYVGVAAAGLISKSPGLACSFVLALEWEHLLLTGEGSFGETFDKWDEFDAGAQAGALLFPASDTPYLLAGIEHRVFVDIVNEHRGRTDVSLTGEAGYLIRRESERQVWLGVRGIVPLSSSIYSASSPHLPFAVLVAKFLL
jgi:hypothetical protein